MQIAGRMETDKDAIFKKGSRKKAGNYRPARLTSIVGKIMEGFVRDHIVDHMSINTLFSTQQYGFIKGRSTSLQLMNVMDVWTKAIDDGFSIDTVYLDFMKAFDTVPHRRLLHKLNAYGISGAILEWVRNFLEGRLQVCVNGINSEWANIISGIPQR